MFFDFFWTDFVVDVLHFYRFSRWERKMCILCVKKYHGRTNRRRDQFTTQQFLISYFIFISTSLQRRKIGKGFARFQFQSSTFSNNVKLAKEDGARKETLFIICKIRYQCFRHEMSCSQFTYISKSRQTEF